jgi:hypothetical protein
LNSAADAGAPVPHFTFSNTDPTVEYFKCDLGEVALPRPVHVHGVQAVKQSGMVAEGSFIVIVTKPDQQLVKEAA